MKFIQKLSLNDSRVIAIYGKTVRGITSRYEDSPLHIVSAFVQNKMLILCQKKVFDKSKEGWKD